MANTVPDVRLTFAGEASHEALELGDHITVRRGSKYRPSVIKKYDRALLVDEATGHKAIGAVLAVVYGVLPRYLDNHASLIERFERSPYRSTSTLLEALKEFYPDLGPNTELTVIAFRTYLAEVPDDE